jgi:H+/gluconate symporter-like permease
MITAVALILIFAGMAVLMYLNRLPAIIALPIMAVAIALAARVPWPDVANIVGDGAFLLHKAYATAMLGAILDRKSTRLNSSH